MDLVNTTLDDIAAVIGFTPTCRLAAWFGDGSSLYVPRAVQEGQVLVRLIGLSAAKKLSAEWGGEILALPRLRGYEDDQKRRLICRMAAGEFSTREIATFTRMGERRVQQIVRELEAAGLLNPIFPKKSTDISQDEIAGEKDGGDSQGELAQAECGGKSPGEKGGVKAQCDSPKEKAGGKSPGEKPGAKVGGKKAQEKAPVGSEWLGPLLPLALDA
jgi:hypothetical protein